MDTHPFAHLPRLESTDDIASHGGRGPARLLGKASLLCFLASALVLAVAAAIKGTDGVNTTLAVGGAVIGVWGLLLAVHGARELSTSSARVEHAMNHNRARADLDSLNDVLKALTPLLRTRSSVSSRGEWGRHRIDARRATDDHFASLHGAVRSAAAIALPDCRALVEALVPDPELREILGVDEVDLEVAIDAAYREARSAQVTRLMRLTGSHACAERVGLDDGAYEEPFVRERPVSDLDQYLPWLASGAA